MENKGGCKTCELIKDIKKYDESRKEEPFATVIMKAALVSEIWKKGHYNGQASYKTREIKFCPECGRRLRRPETRWKI